MPPTNPCINCKDEGYCPIAGVACKQALDEWLEDRFYSCPEHRPAYHHGVEGCYA